MTEETPADNTGDAPVKSSSPEASAATPAAPGKKVPAATPEPDTGEAGKSADAPEAARPKLPPLPEAISINAFREKTLSEIYAMLEALPVKIPARASKSQLVFDLVSFYAREGVEVTGEGSHP